MLEYFLLDKSNRQICLFKNYYLIAMKTSCQLIFPLSDESKTTKKSVGGKALAHFLFLCPQPCPGYLLSMGHRNILSFPGTWAWRKFHLLSPLSLYFQVQDVEFLDFFIASVPAEYSKCPQHSWCGLNFRPSPGPGQSPALAFPELFPKSHF